MTPRHSLPFTRSRSFTLTLPARNHELHPLPLPPSHAAQFHGVPPPSVPLVRSLPHPLPFPLTHPLTHSLTHRPPLSHSPSHSPTRALTLTHFDSYTLTHTQNIQLYFLAPSTSRERADQTKTPGAAIVTQQQAASGVPPFEEAKKPPSHGEAQSIVLLRATWRVVVVVVVVVLFFFLFFFVFFFLFFLFIQTRSRRPGSVGETSKTVVTYPKETGARSLLQLATTRSARAGMRFLGA